MAEEDLVEVELEDLLLAQGTFHLQGEQQFGELAPDGLLRGEVEVARHLHGDGTAALGALPGARQAEPGPPKAHEVDPRVLEEAAVLDGQEGVEQGRRQVLVDHRATALDAKLRHQIAFCGVDPQRLRELHLHQPLGGRQTRQGHIDHHRHADGPQGQQVQRDGDPGQDQGLEPAKEAAPPALGAAGGGSRDRPIDRGRDGRPRRQRHPGRCPPTHRARTDSADPVVAGRLAR